MSCQHQYVDGTSVHFPLGKPVCVGRGYAEHAKELNNPVPTEPLLFIKPGSYVMPVSSELNLPQGHGSVHYEAEIAVLIDKPLSREPNCEEVLNAISGYAPALGPALREVQAKLKEEDLPWGLTKNFDGVDMLSPFVNADQFPDPTDIGIRLTINSEMCQDGNSRDILNPIVPLIQHTAGHFSLQAGDAVLTGTSSGIGPLSSGGELLLELPGASRFETRVL